MVNSRKDDHLQLAMDPAQLAHEEHWWDQVLLIHNALPELNQSELDLTTHYPCGSEGMPLMVAGMTGGTEAADSINRMLAAACSKTEIPLGLGSIRPLLSSGIRAGYDLKAQYPTLRLYGNLGATQLIEEAKIDFSRLRTVVEELQLDAFCIHLNPAQELLQPEGDRSFSGLLDGIRAFSDADIVPVIIKETGSGIAPMTAAALAEAGIQWIDVAGRGGTSWTWIENARADNPLNAFDNWGIPAPASLFASRKAIPRLNWIASGGIRNGLDAVRALALGAHMAGMARPVLSACQSGGEAAVTELLHKTIREMQMGATLLGSANLNALHHQTVGFTPELQAWINLLAG